MGFALFESSGTFNPANYGLVIGDTIQVVAVGGGKGGQDAVTATSGTNGSASSFGRYVTAAGASAQVDAEGIAIVGSDTLRIAIGSDGEHGWGSALWRMPAWIPGIDIDVFNMRSALPVSDTIYVFRNAGATDKAMNGGSAAGNIAFSLIAGGRGGLGYGAGGGGSAYTQERGSYAGAGGKAGTVKIAAITLSSLSAITVTVGAGGAGSGTTAKGGAGANGCVAVFW